MSAPTTSPAAPAPADPRGRGAWAGVGDVVHVVLDPGVPAFGRKGCSVHVQEVLRRLAARPGPTGAGAPPGGPRTHLVAARLGGPVPAGLEDVVVHELGRPRADGPAGAERALVALDERAADLVGALVRDAVARGGPAPLVVQRYGLWSAAVLETARAEGATTVLEVNAPLVDEQERHRVLVDRELALATTRRALRASDLALAVSRAVAAWAQDLSGRPVLVVPNGVDAERFAPAAARPDPLPGEPLVVGFVGTFRPWHGLEGLVDAAAELGATGDRVRLLLVGDGPTREDVLARAAAADVEVEAPGAVAPEDVPGLLARCHAAAAPYPAGPAYFSPLKLAEYLAAGLPVVAAAVADVPELVRPTEALLVEPGDDAALAAALRRLVREPALRRSLAAAGRRAAVERLGWEEVVRRTVAGALEGRARREGPGHPAAAGAVQDAAARGAA